MDLRAIDAYLAYRYIPIAADCVPRVRKLPPAHRSCTRTGDARVERYWRLDFGRKATFSTEEEAIERLREHLRERCVARMISDVPLGAFLSGRGRLRGGGGGDGEASTEPVKTFSIGFPPTLDERPLARGWSRSVSRTDHHELVVEPDGDRDPAAHRPASRRAVRGSPPRFRRSISPRWRGGT